jgi:hypothetical protein
MEPALNHHQLEARLICLNPSELGCRVKIAELRRLMDAACDQRIITVLQFRSLLEKIALVHEKLVPAELDSLRHPLPSGYELTN